MYHDAVERRKIAREIKSFRTIGGKVDGMSLIFSDDMYQIFEIGGNLKVFRNGYEQTNFCPNCTVKNFDWVKSEVIAAIDEELDTVQEFNEQCNFFGVNADFDWYL